jgi:hypothetical protein
VSTDANSIRKRDLANEGRRSERTTEDQGNTEGGFGEVSAGRKIGDAGMNYLSLSLIIFQIYSLAPEFELL